VAIVSIGAFFAFQRGLQTGPAIPVIALMTVMTNLVAVLGGLVVFGEPLGATPLLVALHTAAFALAGVAAWLLARAHARLAERGAALQVMGATETVSGSAPLQRTTRPPAAPASTSLAGVEHGI
jgi:high-affinity Fe2+/Pb2+ permease